MRCKVDGCEREAVYKEQRVCQKHYFRFMRNGTYEITRSRKFRISNPAGYQKLYLPDHKLANSDGYVYEHRKVVFDDMGESIYLRCELCAKSVTWSDLHIDHIDKDVTNNSRDNLRITCRPCNTFRDRKPYYEDDRTICIEYGGKKDTPTGWSRDERVKVSGATIRRRFLSGMTAKDALFSEKKTHRNQ